MSCIKKFIPALFLIVPVFFSTNSFAFNTPKEFVSRGTQTVSHSSFFTASAVNKNQGNNSRRENIKTELLSAYSQWKGTRYHLGGSSHRGVDCSALMQHIFNDSLHESLPRTTFEQMKDGEHISKDKLKPGDLVFFKTTPSMRHVGVYLGNSEFMHASSSHGVTISSLDNEYWVRHYETARRLELES